MSNPRHDGTNEIVPARCACGMWERRCSWEPLRMHEKRGAQWRMGLSCGDWSLGHYTLK